jgi:hypothetical protein
MEAEGIPLIPPRMIPPQIPPRSIPGKLRRSRLVFVAWIGKTPQPRWPAQSAAQAAWGASATAEMNWLDEGDESCEDAVRKRFGHGPVSAGQEAGTAFTLLTCRCASL